MSGEIKIHWTQIAASRHLEFVLPSLHCYLLRIYMQANSIQACGHAASIPFRSAGTQISKLQVRIPSYVLRTEKLVVWYSL